jgi:hypothetical protein
MDGVQPPRLGGAVMLYGLDGARAAAYDLRNLGISRGLVDDHVLNKCML